MCCVASANRKKFSKGTRQVFSKHPPSGSSAKTVIHWLEWLRLTMNIVWSHSSWLVPEQVNTSWGLGGRNSAMDIGSAVGTTVVKKSNKHTQPHGSWARHCDINTNAGRRVSKHLATDKEKFFLYEFS